ERNLPGGIRGNRAAGRVRAGRGRVRRLHHRRDQRADGPAGAPERRTHGPLPPGGKGPGGVATGRGHGLPRGPAQAAVHGHGRRQAGPAGSPRPAQPVLEPHSRPPLGRRHGM
ncbi:MAG: Transcriptional regulator, PadR family, partial [uncultured Cytophagales bacterium]